MTAATNFSIRSAEEAKTVELITGWLAKDSTKQIAYVICPAIKAMWYASCSADQLISIARAMNNGWGDEEEMRAELTRMVRAKILRTRMNQGKRLYEVNY